MLDIDASVVLHVFLGLSSRGWSGLDGLLTAAEAARARRRRCAPAPAAAAVPLEPGDAALFGVLAADGRATTARLAAAAGISEGRAARRLATLIRQGTLVIDVDLAHDALGFTVAAQIHFTVSPARLREAGAALARLPEVGFVAAMSGRSNLMASAACRDLAHLYEFTTGRAGALEGIVSMEVVPFARVVKQAGGMVVDGRLAQRRPDRPRPASRPGLGPVHRVVEAQGWAVLPPGVRRTRVSRRCMSTVTSGTGRPANR